MNMAVSTCYRPVLLTKRGERGALADCSTALKSQLLPVLEVEPIPWDFEADAPAKGIDEHLASKPTDLAQSWGLGRSAVDMRFLGDELLANGEHPLLWMTGAANGLGLPLEPSVGINRTPAYRQAAAMAIARDGHGATVRLPLAEWPTNLGASHLDDLLRELGVGPEAVDLILDLEAEVVAAPGLALTAVNAEIAGLPYRDDWRSLTIAGSAFPQSLSGYPKAMNTIDRAEWMLYQAVCATSPSREPMYGDYAIAHPDPSVDVNPAYMSISGSLRYTVESHWLVPKGELFKGQGGLGIGGAAITPLAQALVAHPEFMQSGHCSTDEWIVGVAGGESGGNPEQWRKRGTRHHLQVVTDQLASPSAPSTTP